MYINCTFGNGNIFIKKTTYYEKGQQIKISILNSAMIY
jgi:hypothetical protein